MKKRTLCAIGMGLLMCLCGCSKENASSDKASRYKSVDEYVESVSNKENKSTFKDKTDCEADETAKISNQEEKNEESVAIWEGGPDEEFPLNQYKPRLLKACVTYDMDGNEVKRTEYDNRGKLQKFVDHGKTIEEYQYDKKGNRVLELSYILINGKKYYQYATKFTSDKNGKVKKQIYYLYVKNDTYTDEDENPLTDVKEEELFNEKYIYSYRYADEDDMDMLSIPEVYDENGEKINVTKYEYDYYKDGSVKTEYGYMIIDNSEFLAMEKEFDKKGRICKNYRYALGDSPKEFLEGVEYEYKEEKDGLLKTRTRFAASKVFSYREETKYNKDQKPVKRIKYDYHDIITESEFWEYNALGNVISNLVYRNDELECSRKYDHAGNLIEFAAYFSNGGQHVIRDECVYDTDGNRISSTTYDTFSKKESTSTYEYY